MTERFRETFKDLNMTSEEVTRFAEAMKKEEFRKLLVEYAEEISDPKNRQLYEEEISKLEQERGNDVVFVHPEPGYCIKTVQNGSLKCFVNVCKNAALDKPTAEREVRKGAGSGLVWQIPHTCSKPRQDLDQSGKNECVVYDVVFHPDAYRMGETNQRFNQLLKDSAFDTIENNFGVKLDRVNAKLLKNLNFKGKPTASVIRRPAASKPAAAVVPQSTASSDDQIGSIIDQLKKDYFEKQSKDSAAQKQPVNNQSLPVSKTEIINKQSAEEEEQEGSKKYTAPVYKMVHRGQVDMQDYSANIDNSIVATTRPKELFIQIELPLCKSSVDLILDIFERRLYLESNEPNYKLDLKLPYPVDEKEARAKFDKSKRCLNVTLPVVSFSAKVEMGGNLENGHVDQNSVNKLSNDQEPEQQVNKEEERETKSQLNSVPSIKYNLPSKTYVSEYKTSYSIRMKVSSYDPESVRLSIVDSVIHVYAESTSKSSGYTQYYQAYVRISDKLKTDQLAIIQNIGLDNLDQVKSSLRIVPVNEDFFEIKILKKLFQNTLSNFWISSSSSNSADSSKVEVNTDTASQIDQAWTESQINKSALVDLSNSKNLNELSRKDYVLGFEQNMSKLDEDDSDEDEHQHAKNKENKDERRSKFDKIDQVEKQRFEKKRPAPLSPPATIDEEIVDENEDDDDQNMSDTEKDYLQKQTAERSRPMDIGGSLRNDENNNSMNSLSSSANDFGSSLSSSSNTFYRLKSILKKPRSVSESESSNSSPGLPPDTPDSMPSMSGMLSRGGSLTSQMSQNSGDDQQHSQSKRVSFSNNVIRNTFKTGSTVAGMRKPGHASKKKNKRKRTVSDPSHDSGADAMDLKQSMSNGTTSDPRARSMSESSDDNMFISASNESLEDENETESSKQPDVVETNNAAAGSSGKKKKKKKNNQIAESKKDDSSKTAQIVPKSGFDVETMLEWKNQGKLSEESQNGTKCGFKFKNKLIDQLD